MPIKIGKFDMRPLEGKFMHAVVACVDKNEEKMLEMAVDKMAETLGKCAWAEGYKFKDVKMRTQDLEKGKKRAIGFEISTVREHETIRQYCYQFVKIAEDLESERVRLTAEMEAIQKKWWFKLFRRF